MIEEDAMRYQLELEIDAAYETTRLPREIDHARIDALAGTVGRSRTLGGHRDRP